MSRSLKGKVAFVTGASRGIGRGVALAFAEGGASIAALARGRGGLESLASEIEGRGGACLPLVADLGREEQVAAAAQGAIERFGRVDFLVNAAGRYLEKSVVETSPEAWDEVLGVNLRGIFLTCRALLPAMGRGGVIFNFSSVGGRIGLKGKSAYCASKFGVAGFSKALAKELKPRGIKVHILYPYMVDSAETEDFGREPLDILRVEDVAEAVLFLAALPRRMVIEDVYLDTFLKRKGSRVQGAEDSSGK